MMLTPVLLMITRWFLQQFCSVYEK